LRRKAGVQEGRSPNFSLAVVQTLVCLIGVQTLAWQDSSLAVDYFFVALYPLLPIPHYQLPIFHLLSKPEGLDSIWGPGCNRTVARILGSIFYYVQT